ncbi:hypothetical protein OG563_44185 [Nocardia vinacea]|uniref:MmpS family membrane protein n=1 Tax=Nocardia vinacea TaxID=96468 RepID=A0ABZ1YUR9_9NOCA|nr:hypothetical protein [Nocardia vinacea]
MKYLLTAVLAVVAAAAVFLAVGGSNLDIHLPHGDQASDQDQPTGKSTGPSGGKGNSNANNNSRVIDPTGPTGPTGTPAKTTKHTVVFDVTGSGKVRDLSWSDGASSYLAAGATTLPYSRTLVSNRTSGFVVFIEGTPDPVGAAHCKITVDGKVVADQQSTARGMLCRAEISN